MIRCEKRKMAFWVLLEVASIPVLRFLLISGLGAFLATSYMSVLTADARLHINKIVFIVFTPALAFSSLAKSVTFENILSWWYMPVNILITFLIGGLLGWIVVKLTSAPRRLSGLVVGNCCAANMGNLLLFIVPALCEQNGSPFGNADVCMDRGMAYASFSLAFFQLPLKKLTNGLQLKEIMAPPTIGAVLGFIVGAIPQTKGLFVGQSAPLQVIQDSIALLGDGTIPSITLILGGNLTKGLQSAPVKPSVVIGIILVRFLMLPLAGIGVVKAAIYFGAVPADPLYHFILLIQFALPPAMSLGTMTQLFGVGESECSVIFLWTYLLAAIAVTVWSTFYMWILI